MGLPVVLAPAGPSGGLKRAYPESRAYCVDKMDSGSSEMSTGHLWARSSIRTRERDRQKTETEKD